MTIKQPDTRNLENFVIHSHVVWTKDEWEFTGMSEKYDDVLRCIVDLNHPLAQDEVEMEKQLIQYWSNGVKPDFVVTLQEVPEITSADYLYNVAMHMSLDDLHIEELEKVIAAMKEHGYSCFREYLLKLDN